MVYTFYNIKICAKFASLLFCVFFMTNEAFSHHDDPNPWGFFGHKRINRMAVFTLPPEMIGFYKKNIEFITEHAVDPDKRRYATKHEAPRHFMDLDRYGEAPFADLPRNWTDALIKFSNIYIVENEKDTIKFIDNQQTVITKKNIIFKSRYIKNKLKQDSIVFEKRLYKRFFQINCERNFYEDEQLIAPDSIKNLFATVGISLKGKAYFWAEDFSQHGIVPYHLEAMQKRLTKAFQDKDVNKILRLSAEIGHYIGDAHVPLHTTENYNGQLTNQNGIHGFWESRIPELFADEQYDFFVGKATYIEEPNKFYWNVVLKSHQYVDSVLLIEKDLSQTFPKDRQSCFDERMGLTVKTYCEEYAKAYSDRLAGMVEDRMRSSILTVGTAWHTAWLDAGQPDLSALFDGKVADKTKEDEALEKASSSGGQMIGRGEN
jgi:hypothetical protein